MNWGKPIQLNNGQKHLNLFTPLPKAPLYGRCSKKNLLRWYLTPSCISKIYHNASPKCWRMWGEYGTLFHILWSCPKIKPLWSQIENIMRTITRLKHSLKPEMAILSLELEFTPPSHRTLISHILLATRLTILRHWKDIEAPTIWEVIATTHMHGTY